MSHCAFLGEPKLAPKRNTKKKHALHKKSGANKEDSILETVESSTYKISVGSGGREFSPNKSSSELGCPNARRTRLASIIFPKFRVKIKRYLLQTPLRQSSQPKKVNLFRLFFELSLHSAPAAFRPCILVHGLSGVNMGKHWAQSYLESE